MGCVASIESGKHGCRLATLLEAHSPAASFDAGSIARFATNANSTRSTSVVNLRPPSTFASAVSTPSWRHRPSRSQATPIGGDATIDNPSPASSTDDRLLAEARRHGLATPGLGRAVASGVADGLWPLITGTAAAPLS